MISKNEIRTAIKLQRENINPLDKQIFDGAIIQHIEKNNDYKNANVVLAYIPHNNEVNIVEQIQNKKLVLPRVNGVNLDLYLIDNFDDLEEGSFGILEPKTNCESINPEEIDIAFIPGIAFDKQGHRIGFGKGYYDKLSKQLKCLKIGLAYDFQIVDEIPFESHDVPVDLIITN